MDKCTLWNLLVINQVIYDNNIWERELGLSAFCEHNNGIKHSILELRALWISRWLIAAALAQRGINITWRSFNSLITFHDVLGWIKTGWYSNVFCLGHELTHVLRKQPLSHSYEKFINGYFFNRPIWNLTDSALTFYSDFVPNIIRTVKIFSIISRDLPVNLGRLA